MIIVDVFVPGAAKTKGSLVIRNRKTGALKESVVGSSAWRALMAQAVRDDIARRHDHPNAEMLHGGLPYSDAVAVTVEAFLLPPQLGGQARWWSWPTWERAGDLDKIVHNVLDALSAPRRRTDNPKLCGGAIEDDNLACRLVAEKRVAPPETSPGVRIKVETL